MDLTAHLDFETYSACPIDLGAFRYASDPSTEILLCAFQTDNMSRPLIWRNPKYCKKHSHLRESANVVRKIRKHIKKDGIIYAHNSQFEHAVSKYRLLLDMGIKPPHLTTWRCTAAMARRAAMPAALAKVAPALGLKQIKDTHGKALIKQFSCVHTPGKRADIIYGREPYRVLPTDDPEAFEEYAQYCIQDVVVEKAVHNKLSMFELSGASLATFLFDAALNDRGIPVNVAALKKALKIVRQCEKQNFDRFHKLTGLAPTQRAKILAWLQKEGYPHDNLQAETVAKAIKDYSWGNDLAHTVLELREQSSYAATAKIATMLEAVCEDGFVRGVHLYYGARTGRWSGKIIQPQNLKRPTFKDTDLAYEMICNGCSKEDLEMLWGNPLEIISSCVRHFIQRAKGKINDADYAAMEARIVCWLAGQEDALEMYRNPPVDSNGDVIDPYIDMATTIFNLSPEEIDDIQRWLGKQAVLGCGFQMGAPRFYEQSIENAEKFKIDIVVTKKLSRFAVKAYRKKYDKVAALWRKVDTAAKWAIMEPGKRFRAGRKLSFYVLESKGIPYLVMKLPSGRNIVYPHPKIVTKMKTFVDDETGEKTRRPVEQIKFWGQLPGKAFWGDLYTYGGKLVENATQGLNADITSIGAINATNDGYNVFMLVHDEALADDDLPMAGFIKALTRMPAWADGLPVAADGKVIPYYKKI